MASVFDCRGLFFFSLSQLSLFFAIWVGKAKAFFLTRFSLLKFTCHQKLT